MAINVNPVIVPLDSDSGSDSDNEPPPTSAHEPPPNSLLPPPNESILNPTPSTSRSSPPLVMCLPSPPPPPPTSKQTNPAHQSSQKTTANSELPQPSTTPTTSKNKPPTPPSSQSKLSSSKFQCPKCNAIFSRLCELLVHKGTHVNCPKCNKEFKGKLSNKKFKTHLKSCAGPKEATLFKCFNCPSTFKYPSQLRQHEVKCKDWFFCPHCTLKLKLTMEHNCSQK